MANFSQDILVENNVIKNDIIDIDLVDGGLEEKYYINIERSKFEKDITFRNCTFLSLNLNKIIFKGSLTFSKCIFENEIDLKKIKINGSLNFFECKFMDALQMFGCDVKNELLFFCGNSGYPIELNKIKAKRVSFNECALDRLNIFSSDVSSSIKEIYGYKTRITNDLRLCNIIAILNITLLETSSQYIEFNNITLGEGSVIDTKNCFSTYWAIENIKLGKNSFVNIQKNSMSKFYISGIDLEEGDIKLNDNIIDGFLKINNVALSSGYIDFSNTVASELILSENLYSFLKDKKAKNIIFNPDKDQFQQKIDTLNKFVKMFGNNFQYDWQDECFYHLKTFESLKMISSSNFFPKIIKLIYYYICRFLLGWGVKLSNIMISAVLIIFVFSIFYTAELWSGNNNGFYFQNVQFENFFSPFFLSFLVFIGFYASINLPSDLYLRIGLIEHIIGIIYITLTVGVIIRKIVR